MWPIGTVYPQPVYATMLRDGLQSMYCLYQKERFPFWG
jgi:hypothetical protein